MPARPGGTCIGILKLADPLEGSTCTDAACTLELTPALAIGVEESCALVAFEAAVVEVDFVTVVFFEELEEMGDL